MEIRAFLVYDDQEIKLVEFFLAFFHTLRKLSFESSKIYLGKKKTIDVCIYMSYVPIHSYCKIQQILCTVTIV